MPAVLAINPALGRTIETICDMMCKGIKEGTPEEKARFREMRDLAKKVYFESFDVKTSTTPRRQWEYAMFVGVLLGILVNLLTGHPQDIGEDKPDTDTPEITDTDIDTKVKAMLADMERAIIKRHLQ